MTAPGSPLARAIDVGLLAGAWLIVPGSERTDWWREWRGELWQARGEHACDGRVSWTAERALIGFCLGAYLDAVCLRRLEQRTRRARKVRFGAAWQCIALLAGILLVSFLLSRVMPGVLAEKKLAEVSTRGGLVLIQDANNEDSPATISRGQYRAWKNGNQKFFDEFAFYRVTQEKVSWQRHDEAGWDVARTSANFFGLLGIPVKQSATRPGDALPGVVLSESAWRREFGANPHVAGSVVVFGASRATIVGVVPDGAWGLPGKVDAWVLDTEPQGAADGAGYVVAHLSSLGQSAMRTSSVRITSYAPRRSPDDMLGISVCRGVPKPMQIYLFGVLLALLALPAVTSVSLSEFSVSFHEISWKRRTCRWGFLVAKIVLLLPTAYFSGIDLGYGIRSLGTGCAMYMQLIITVAGCLFGMCWALSDQRKRCPVCLELVAYPARVGQFSRTFLAWSGTELMCTSGHTLLHVPELPTSWFSSQRWLFLDASWKFLFANPVRE